MSAGCLASRTWLVALVLTLSLATFVLLKHQLLPCVEVSLRPVAHTTATGLHGGVSHYAVAYNSALLHIFVKGVVREGGQHWVRGFVSLENGQEADPTGKRGAALSDVRIGVEVPGIDTAWGRLESFDCLLQSGALDCLGSRRVRPTWFSFMVNNVTHSRLVVKYCDSYIPLSPILASAPEFVSQKNRVRHILSTNYGALEKPAVFMKWMEVQLHHHEQLKIEGTTHYCRPFDCFALRQYFSISPMPKQLELVDWTHILPKNHSVRYHDQAVQYNHAVLSFYGTGSYLFIADIDEYLMAAPLDSKSCLMRFLDMRKCISLSVFSALPDPEVSSSMELTSQLKYISSKNHSIKSFIDPDVGFGFGVHEGAVCMNFTPTGCTIGNACARLTADCAQIAHYRNMFRQRETLSAEFMYNDTWYRLEG